MKFREKRERKPNIILAPLIDVLFLLLIFFVVSSTFTEQPGIKLELPAAQHPDVTALQPFVLTISSKGELFLNRERIQEAELVEKLRHVAATDRSGSLTLKADRTVPYGLVIKVMDAARGCGIRRIATTVRTEE